MAGSALDIQIAVIKFVFVKRVGSILIIMMAVQAFQKTHVLLVGKVYRGQV